MPRFDLNDLAPLHAFLETQPDAIVPVGIERIRVGAGAVNEIASLVSQCWPDQRDVVVVMDAQPKKYREQPADQVLREALASGLKLRKTIVLGNGEDALGADLEPAKELSEALPRNAVIISFGSGTITDLVKHALFMREEGPGLPPQPWLCVPTAASVTAYTSNMAVLTVRGVKRTLPSRLPDAILCDTQLLADAPLALTQAGFGDMLARCVAHGDWYLARLAGADRSFTTLPDQLLGEIEDAIVAAPEKLPRRDLDAIATLMQGLLLAGVAMTVLGQTTPISGWEHAISHAIDLWAAHTGRDHGLHGIQVGAASWVSARYFAALIDHFDADRIDPRTWYQTREQAERDLRQHWSGWIKNPETLDELWHDAEAKWQQWRGNRDALEAFAKAWRTGEPADTLQQLVKPPSFFEQAITRVRAAETLLDATPNFAADIACRILQGAHLVRRRFTVGDVLAPLGWINGPSPDVRR